MDYWEQVLRLKAASLTSLAYFKPNFMSLVKPHPLWTTAGSSPSKMSMATVQARMVSGRYRSELLCSNWSKNSDTAAVQPIIIFILSVSSGLFCSASGHLCGQQEWFGCSSPPVPYFQDMGVLSSQRKNETTWPFELCLALMEQPRCKDDI